MLCVNKRAINLPDSSCYPCPVLRSVARTMYTHTQLHKRTHWKVMDVGGKVERGQEEEEHVEVLLQRVARLCSCWPVSLSFSCRRGSGDGGNKTAVTRTTRSETEQKPLCSKVNPS